MARGKRHTVSKDEAKIKDIMKILKHDTVKKKKKPVVPPKMKVYKTPHFKDTCVPMHPSMHTRLRYITHCDTEPPSAKVPAKTEKDYEFERIDEKKRIAVRYDDEEPCKVLLTAPVAFVKHTDSDKSIINLPSPKTSGEVIAAQKAFVKPADVKPPLPGKSALDLFKPHSGIYLNRDKEFVPDVVYFPGPYKVHRKKKTRPCYTKGGICRNADCTKIKCRRAAYKRRLMLAEKLKSGLIKGRMVNGVFKPDTDALPSKRKGKRRFNLREGDDECGLDDMNKPEYPHIPEELESHMLQTHSLTVLPCIKTRAGNVPYGILRGTYNMYSDKFGPKSRGKQALAISVMSYALAFHYHPKLWTMKLIDHLMDAGDEWYLQLLDKMHDHSAYFGMCEALPYGKKQTLVLNHKRMLVLLNEPYIIGYTLSTDPTVYNLCRALKTFFKENRAGVMMSRVVKVMIWKDKVCYYMFDPAGRNSKAFTDFSQGTAALINVKDPAAIADLLLSRSILEDQKFLLAPVKVLRMVDEKSEEDFEEERELTQAEKASMSYRIMNENCAIVNATMHLGDRCFEDAKFRQALPIALAAMAYAKISPPNTWYSKTLDKILRLGNKMYVDFAPPNPVVDLKIDNIPNEIILGPYSCEIIIYRERAKGQLFSTKECLLNIRSGLREFFSHEHNSGIIEFNNYVLGVWRQKDMFYMFDPYPRTNDGERALKFGKACCFMLLNTDSVADVFTRNWDYLPPMTQFYIHAFKLLKIKKKQPKAEIKCSLSDDQLPGARVVKRRELPEGQGRGDSPGPGGTKFRLAQDVLPDGLLGDSKFGMATKEIEEEQMGDIISLVDSIQDDFVPYVPKKFKNMPPEEEERIKSVNLDSPTVSVTQVVPAWPKPRDKANEPPEPDPSREPTPPPTPPPLPEPEGGVEAEGEEEDEEELDEEALKAKKEEMLRKKMEEEEARRKAEELPPPLPPPPPSPQPSHLEVPLAPPIVPFEDEEEVQPYAIQRQVLLTEDARKRSKLRQLRKKITRPLEESTLDDAASPSQELLKPSNFKTLPDSTQIIRGSKAVPENEIVDVLPFAAIMAVIVSYKYTINTWTPAIVDYVIDGGEKLHKNKKERFQLSPLHVIPRIGVGNQSYHANIDVVDEGPTWKLEEILERKFLLLYDRGILTTSNYSCAFFVKNGVYYLFDASPCNAMGLRENPAGNKSTGKASFMRFKNLHDLCARIISNKDGRREDQQFILSRILVRKLLPEPRYKLSDDYDYTGEKKSKGKVTLVDGGKDKKKKETETIDQKKKLPPVGYEQFDGGLYRIEGTTSVAAGKGTSGEVGTDHFACLIAMLQATMHPLKTWDSFMVDTCIEKGQEIKEKCKNSGPCEKRVIKNIILDGKFMNVNIKKIIVINDNPTRTIQQYLRAVLRRLRYVMIRYPSCTLVIVVSGGYYHLFDPFPTAPKQEKGNTKGKEEEKEGEKEPEERKLKIPLAHRNPNAVASWTLHRNQDALIKRISEIVSDDINEPEFYTFELTSVKNTPRHAALNYKLSPLFSPENPNAQLVKPRKARKPVDEKLYWLSLEYPPWSRMSPVNDMGFERKTTRTMWKDWDIEFPGDLYSLWGTVHPLDDKFSLQSRGKQYLATCVVALVMVRACSLKAWTASFLDGVVHAGDQFTQSIISKIGNKPNHEISVEDCTAPSEALYPYSFTVKFENIIFGFVFNNKPDRFNLSKALQYFFEVEFAKSKEPDKSIFGLLISPCKNLAFGRTEDSYFMFDCQSYGLPIFNPFHGTAYMLKCESLSRLIYCITMTLNIRRHGQQFHLYSASITLTEKTK